MTRFKEDNVELLENRGLISVIVPVYNVEQYLERCVSSILNQTYRKFELILINDGSTDECPKICERYAQIDNRIIVVHKENGGLSDARNVGLQIAKGEYITFVDSDDLIAPNALQLLISYSVNYNSDIVISTKIESFDKEVNCINAKVEKSIVVDFCEAEKMIFCENTRWEAWGTLYKSNVIKGEKFPLGKLYEDLALIPLLVLKSERVCFIDATIYYYFQRVGSIMDASKTKVGEDLLEICKQLLKEMNTAIENTKELYDVNAGILMELCSRVDLAERNYALNREFILKSRKFLRHTCNYVLLSKIWGVKRKFNYITVCLGLGKVWRGLYKLKRTGR